MIKSLCDCKVGEEVTIINLLCTNKRLINLGINRGNKIKVLYKNKINIVVSILGSCYAIEKSLASNIQVV